MAQDVTGQQSLIYIYSINDQNELYFTCLPYEGARGILPSRALPVPSPQSVSRGKSFCLHDLSVVYIAIGV